MIRIYGKKIGDRSDGRDPAFFPDFSCPLLLNKKPTLIQAFVELWPISDQSPELSKEGLSSLVHVLYTAKFSEINFVYTEFSWVA